ncbi:hypothetical protein GGC64_000476 [Mycobacterium sp. OAS707]|nr:hypothetical protein [Mycobacterium sp. OAS707]
MLKKLLVGIVAAGAVSVPLAGAAWAAGDPQSGGGQGTGPGVTGPPGNTTSFVSHEFGGHTGKVFETYTGLTPGQYQQQSK